MEPNAILDSDQERKTPPTDSESAREARRPGTCGGIPQYPPDEMYHHPCITTNSNMACAMVM